MIFEETGQWQIFVYSAYFIVALCLFSYTWYALLARKKYLTYLYEEGFFEQTAFESPRDVEK
jgi:hypothetical protein